MPYTHKGHEGAAPTLSQSQHYKLVDGQHHAPAAFTLSIDPVLIAGEDGWASGPPCIDPKNLALPGFDPRNVQLILIRYTRLRDPGRPVVVTIHRDVRRFPLPRWVDQFWHFRIHTVTADEKCEFWVSFVPVRSMIGSTATVRLNLDTIWRLVVNFRARPLYAAKKADTHLTFWRRIFFSNFCTPCI